MDYDRMIELFSDDDLNEFLKFERVEHPRCKRPDLHAFLLLNELLPGDQNIVAGATHDEIWLGVEAEMSQDIDKIIAEVERLDREATPGPWAPQVQCHWWGLVPCGPPYEGSPTDERVVKGAAMDTHLIATYRTATPVLARALIQARARIAEVEQERDAALAEVARLRAGGCTRDQRTTQFCAEAVAKDAEIAKLRDQILGYQQQLHIAEQEIARLKGTMIEPTEETGDPDSEQSEGVAR